MGVVGKFLASKVEKYTKEAHFDTCKMFKVSLNLVELNRFKEKGRGVMGVYSLTLVEVNGPN